MVKSGVFRLSRLGTGRGCVCHGHRVERFQRCRQPPYKAQDGPPAKTANSAEMEKTWPRSKKDFCGNERKTFALLPFSNFLFSSLKKVQASLLAQW